MEHLWSQADLIEGGLRRPVYGRRVHAKEAPMSVGGNVVSPVARVRLGKEVSAT